MKDDVIDDVGNVTPEEALRVAKRWFPASESSKREFMLAFHWGKFCMDYAASGQRTEADYTVCRKLAEKGNAACFDQWEAWLIYWAPYRMTQS
ncbi:MAG: hypothetical protein JSS14_22105 [Proteobacteria bacterium]|nr:hypothetical protein [Pseudomonadota bacterium]